MKENSKEALLHCALKLFAEKGYENTGISELVQAAGVTKPTLYYFFENKEGIFRAILDANYQVLNQEIARAAVYTPDPAHYEQDVHGTLLRTVQAFYAYAKMYPDFFRLALVLEQSPQNTLSSQMAMPYVTMLYEIISQMFLAFSKAHGNLTGKETLLTSHFLAIIDADIRDWLYRDGKMDEGTAELLVHEFMHGIYA